MTFMSDGFYSTFQKARAVQGRIRRQIRVETGTADWNTLRGWSRLIAQNSNRFEPERMARLVMRYDPQLKLEKLEHAWIVGGGKGNFNLNAYRCGMLNAMPVFEKIYQLESGSWDRLDWFNTTIAPRLKGRVRTPQLIHKVRGNRLAAAYFEYLPDVASVSVDRCFDTLRRFHKKVADLDMTGQPSWFADFRLEPEYAEGAACLRHILAAARRDPSEIDGVEECLLANTSRKILTHGDLMPGNISKKGIILDWDRCGAFPIGYDFSRVMGVFIMCNSLQDFETFVEGDIACNYAGASGSLHFFAAIEYAKKYCRSRTVRVSDDLILDLFDRARLLQGLSEKARWSA